MGEFRRQSARASSSSTSARKRANCFSSKVGEFLESVRPQLGSSSPPVAFHNGVFGMFEDPRFEDGTRQFIGQLKRMKEAGVEVYVGGGEGGTALEKYGKPDWVTHCFTAGGTVLNGVRQCAGSVSTGSGDGRRRGA